MKISEASNALESLGNETRLGIFRTLVRAGPAGLPVGKLQQHLHIPGSTLSHHISRKIGTLACDIGAQVTEYPCRGFADCRHLGSHGHQSQIDSEADLHTPQICCQRFEEQRATFRQR